MHTRKGWLLLLTTALLGAGCAAAPGGARDGAAAETGFEAPFEPVPEDGAYDRTSSRGPRVPPGGPTEVWPVTGAWDDVDTAAARAPGMAWDADSGLDWRQKYTRWIASFERIPSAQDPGRDTFVIPTPWGERQLPAPSLECAEVAYLLRVAFAAWYGLPFFVEGWDAKTRSVIYAGHFGFVDGMGRPAGRFPRFRRRYADHTDSWSAGERWPQDERLRTMRLGDDDEVPFVADGAGAGAYLDELFLNKRVAQFLRLVLVYYGSVHLAGGRNAFDVVPERLAPGDVLLVRWQRRGIGHTVPVMRVSRPDEDRLRVHVATGSMPRRQPLWKGPPGAHRHLTDRRSGGQGENSNGVAYVELGGGLKRWRTAVHRNGRWRNVVPPSDRAAYIPRSDRARLAERPARYEALLGPRSPEARRDALLAQIEEARAHLRHQPASCVARTNREDAFERLYALGERHLDMDREQIDAAHRRLEDHVFAELEYDRSRTCCWGSATPAMHDIVMALVADRQHRAREAGRCEPPPVFRARADGGDGFERFREHARRLGRADEWAAWRADEPCEGRDPATTDPRTSRGPGPWCAMESARREPCDPDGGDDGPASASPVARGDRLAGRICDDDADWFRVEHEGTVRVRLEFAHEDGDLDIEALDPDGHRVAISQGVTDGEQLRVAAPVHLRVYGYLGATNRYRLSID